MIIRRRLYSEDIDRAEYNNNENIGEALGTATLGATGSIIASKYGGNISKGIASNVEGKKAVRAFRTGAKSAMKKRIESDNIALSKLENFKRNNNDNIFGFGKKKALNKAREAFKNSKKYNKKIYDDSLNSLKRTIVSNKNKNIAKAGRRGKIGTLVTGLGITGLLTGSKLLKNKNKSNTKE